MPTKSTKLHYEVKRKLNRISTNYASNLTVVDLDATLNEAKDLVYENYAAVIESSTTVRNHLRELELKNIELSPSGASNKSVFFEFPEGYYRLSRQMATATRVNCNPREIIVRIAQGDDLSELGIDLFKDPSFDYEETYADEAGSGLHVYKSDNFEIEKITIDYFKKIPDIATPSLTKSGSYTGPDGTLISSDVDLNLDSTYLWRKIVDVAVLIIQKDTGDLQNFQAQMSKILALDKLYIK